MTRKWTMRWALGLFRVCRVDIEFPHDPKSLLASVIDMSHHLYCQLHIIWKNPCRVEIHEKRRSINGDLGWQVRPSQTSFPKAVAMWPLGKLGFLMPGMGGTQGHLYIKKGHLRVQTDGGARCKFLCGSNITGWHVQ